MTDPVIDLAEAIDAACREAGHDPDELRTAAEMAHPFYSEPGDWRDRWGRLHAKDGRVKAVSYENGVEFPVLTVGQAERNANPNMAADAIEMRRDACFPRQFVEHREDTFATLDADTDQRAFGAVSALVAGKSHKPGLVLFGGYGVGKTHLAACACNALVDAGKRCRMTSIASIDAEAARRYGSFPDVMDSLCRNDLVVIDDLGAERGSDYMSQVTFDVVDWLTRRKIPLIVTTNMTRRQLSSPNERARRTIDRIKQRCTLVEVTGPNRRQATL